MKARANQFLVIALCAASGTSLCLVPSGYALPRSQQPQAAGAPRAVAKRIGAIKAINGVEITLIPDSGPDVKIIVLTHSDLEARHQQDLQDWQKRGVDGLASAVDPVAGTVTISVRS